MSTIETYQQYTSDRRSRDDSAPLFSITCMDDRYLSDVDFRRQSHHAGGALGLAVDIGSAAILASHGKFEAKEKSIAAIGRSAGKHLSAQGIELALHDDCAAEHNMAKIISSIALSNEELLFMRTREIVPDIEEDMVARVVQAYSELLKSGVTHDAHVIEEFTPRYAIAGKEHKSRIAIVETREGVTFNTRRAYEEDNAMYHINHGDLPDIARKVSDVFPVIEENLIAASAVRHAATLGFLPHNPQAVRIAA